MITVHHLDNSRSQRVLWLLEELGLPYDIKFYKRHPVTLLAPPELTAVHPLGKAPVVTDGENTVAESGAILEYLVVRHGNARLMPVPGSADHLRYTYWMHFAEGSAMPQQLLKLVFDKVRKAPLPFFAKPIARGIADKVISTFVMPNIERQLQFMEGELAQRDWFAGQAFSAADIQMIFPLESAQVRSGLDSRYPRLMAWVERCHARPAYQRALERGGPYSMAD